MRIGMKTGSVVHCAVLVLLILVSPEDVAADSCDCKSNKITLNILYRSTKQDYMWQFYRQPTKLWEGYTFRPVCLSFYLSVQGGPQVATTHNLWWYWSATVFMRSPLEMFKLVRLGTPRHPGPSSPSLSPGHVQTCSLGEASVWPSTEWPPCSWVISVNLVFH